SGTPFLMNSFARCPAPIQAPACPIVRSTLGTNALQPHVAWAAGAPQIRRGTDLDSRPRKIRAVGRIVSNTDRDVPDVRQSQAAGLNLGIGRGAQRSVEPLGLLIQTRRAIGNPSVSWALGVGNRFEVTWFEITKAGRRALG